MMCFTSSETGSYVARTSIIQHNIYPGKSFFEGTVMSVDHDNHDLEPAGNSEDQAVPEDYEEVLTKLLTKYANLAAPRLFALCRESCEDAEDWVFAWGAAFHDSAILFRSSGKLAGTFSTADNALDLFSRIEDLRLIWICPDISDQSDAIAA
jgi:hypothetical protein